MPSFLPVKPIALGMDQHRAADHSSSSTKSFQRLHRRSSMAQPTQPSLTPRERKHHSSLYLPPIRAPSTFFESSLSLRRLFTTPARKPRTECFCQPVTFIIASIVAPVGDCSIEMTRNCFEPVSAFSVLGSPAGCGESFAPAIRTVDDADDCFFASFGIGDPSFDYQRRLAPPPSKPHLGHQAGGAESLTRQGA